ncbi:MAG: DUF1330 domain-containing protein [bacterium]
MNTLTPNEEELQKLMQHPDTSPVVMVNLLKFKTDTGDGETGEEAYTRYTQNAATFVAKIGGRVLWYGHADQFIIGGPEDRWDRVLLVEYPSRAAFLKMVQMPEFQAVQKERQAALERTVLIATTTLRSAYPDM